MIKRTPRPSSLKLQKRQVTCKGFQAHHPGRLVRDARGADNSITWIIIHTRYSHVEANHMMRFERAAGFGCENSSINSIGWYVCSNQQLLVGSWPRNRQCFIQSNLFNLLIQRRINRQKRNLESEIDSLDRLKFFSRIAFF